MLHVLLYMLLCFVLLCVYCNFENLYDHRSYRSIYLSVFWNPGAVSWVVNGSSSMSQRLVDVLSSKIKGP